MSRAVLSIGSNVGNRLVALQSAVDAFRRWLVAVSPVFETPPWGPVPQGDYLNAVLIAQDPDARPPDWLVRAQGAEDAAGRVREQRWGPRTLDVDVVAVDDVHCDDPSLTLPHPLAAHRAFVLVPWLALDAEAALDGRRLSELVSELPTAEVAAVHRVPEALS